MTSEERDPQATDDWIAAALDGAPAELTPAQARLVRSLLTRHDPAMAAR